MTIRLTIAQIQNHGAQLNLMKQDKIGLKELTMNISQHVVWTEEVETIKHNSQLLFNRPKTEMQNEAHERGSFNEKG